MWWFFVAKERFLSIKAYRQGDLKNKNDEKRYVTQGAPL